jgi:ATP-binding cassette subfamily F protein uup
LEQYLDTYQGVVLVVSHDRYFLDRVVDKLFTIDKGHWNRFYGDYSEYLEKMTTAAGEQPDTGHHEKSAAVPAAQPAIPEEPVAAAEKKTKGITPRELQELDRITQELPRYEAMVKGINAAIAAAGSDYAQVESLLQEQKEAQQKVEDMTERWCELEELKEQ